MHRKGIARSPSQVDARDFDVLVAHVYRLYPIAVGQAHDLKMVDIGNHIGDAEGAVMHVTGRAVNYILALRP